MKKSKKGKVLQVKELVRPDEKNQDEQPKSSYKRYQWRMVENKRSWRLELFLKDVKKFSQKARNFFSRVFRKKS